MTPGDEGRYHDLGRRIRAGYATTRELLEYNALDALYMAETRLRDLRRSFRDQDNHKHSAVKREPWTYNCAVCERPHVIGCDHATAVRLGQARSR